MTKLGWPESRDKNTIVKIAIYAFFFLLRTQNVDLSEVEERGKSGRGKQVWGRERIREKKEAPSRQSQTERLMSNWNADPVLQLTAQNS